MKIKLLQVLLLTLSVAAYANDIGSKNNNADQAKIIELQKELEMIKSEMANLDLSEENLEKLSGQDAAQMESLRLSLETKLNLYKNNNALSPEMTQLISSLEKSASESEKGISISDEQEAEVQEAIRKIREMNEMLK